MQELLDRDTYRNFRLSARNRQWCFQYNLFVFVSPEYGGAFYGNCVLAERGFQAQGEALIEIATQSVFALVYD